MTTFKDFHTLKGVTSAAGEVFKGGEKMRRPCSLTESLRNPLFIDIRTMMDFHDKRVAALSIVEPLAGKVGGFVIPRFSPFPDTALRGQTCKRFFPAYLGDLPCYAQEEARILTLRGDPPPRPAIDGFTVCVDEQIIKAAIRGRAEALSLLREKSPGQEISWLGPAIFVQTYLSHIGLTERAGVLDKILKRVERAQKAGVDGVVISGQELPEVRRRFPQIWIAVAGIRPTYLPKVRDDDQARAISTETALEHQADILIIGRPITQSPNPVRVAEQILCEIENLLRQ